MTSPILAEFLAHEADAGVRQMLLSTIADLTEGRRYFTFNVFNVLVDADAGTATVEDELDVDRETTLSLDEFAVLLRNGDL